MVARYDPHIFLEPIHCAVRAFVEAAGIRIENENSVAIGIKNAIDRVMQQAVAHFGLMDITRLRIVDFECVIGAVPVGFIRKLAVKRKYITR